jgi:hypothetical protein
MLSRTSNPTVHHAPPVQTLWALYSWPPVFWQANLRRRPRFIHLATRVTKSPNPSEHRSGNTIWGDGEAGFAWDWIEIEHGVVAMSNPMGLVTNLQLVAANGELLSSATAALHFNQFVRRIPWQGEVRRLLSTA